jgi:hypothetical protein
MNPSSSCSVELKALEILFTKIDEAGPLQMVSVKMMVWHYLHSYST